MIESEQFEYKSGFACCVLGYSWKHLKENPDDSEWGIDIPENCS
jgi:hypothetical protein